MFKTVDREIFEAVTIDHALGTITWPGDIDLIPTCSEETKLLHPHRRLPDESFSPPDDRRPTDERVAFTTRALLGRALPSARRGGLAGGSCVRCRLWRGRPLRA
jgi:hypothetical protein